MILYAPDANAARYWCSNDGAYNYYVESESISYTRSCLVYVNVARSDGIVLQYTFEPTGGTWKYSTNHGSFVPVRTNKLANDILYMVIQLKPKFADWAKV